MTTTTLDRPTRRTSSRRGALSDYFEQLHRFPCPAREEQQEEGRRLAETRDRLQEAIRDGEGTAAAAVEYEEARKQLVRSHLRLAALLVRPYMSLGMPFADLLQEAHLGMMRAADLFDPDRGVRFATYARWWVRHTVLRAVAETSGPIRIPVPVLLTHWRLRRASSDLSHRLGRAATLEEAARAARVPLREARRALLHGRAPLSLDVDAAVPCNEFATQICYSDTQEKIEERIREAIGTLPEGWRRVLELRFGLAGKAPHSRQEAARELGVTAERIRQIEIEALGRLRDPNRWSVPPDSLL